MKTHLGIIGALLAPGPVLATVLNIGTIEQPVNLGPKADPSRIPLGPVVVESNHDYGIHSVISDPRPCTHGAIAWDKGLELNMNLASAFGIEVVPDDGTQVPRVPVTIRVRDWPAPAYSPYRKDQVLAATLHCLLRSVHAPPQTPLKVVVDAVNPEDARNLRGYAGTYLTAEADDHGGPTPVPGTRLDTDWRGVTWVVFSDHKAPDPGVESRPPSALIPFHIPDETDDVTFELLPVWTGDTWKEERAKLLLQPVTLFYDRYDKSRSSGPDINSFSRLGPVAQGTWEREVDGTELAIRLQAPADGLPERLAPTLAALCHAAVLSLHPTVDVPLTISFRVPKALRDSMKPFFASKDWTARKAERGGDTILSCQFVWDHQLRAITKGSVPLGDLISQTDRPWSVTFDPAVLHPAQPAEDGALPEKEPDA